MDAALQNLDFLRRLIEESRRDMPLMDMLRLRMLYGGATNTQEQNQ